MNSEGVLHFHGLLNSNTLFFCGHILVCRLQKIQEKHQHKTASLAVRAGQSLALILSCVINLQFVREECVARDFQVAQSTRKSMHAGADTVIHPIRVVTWPTVTGVCFQGRAASAGVRPYRPADHGAA